MCVCLWSVLVWTCARVYGWWSGGGGGAECWYAMVQVGPDPGFTLQRFIN